MCFFAYYQFMFALKIIHKDFAQLRADFKKQGEDIQTVKVELKDIRKDIRKFMCSTRRDRRNGPVKNDQIKASEDIKKNTNFREETTDFRFLYKSIQQHQLLLETGQ